MFRKLGLGFVALIALILGYAAFQPNDYVISRQITIARPADAIFPYINNSKLMMEWAPWPDLDPELKMQYSGPEAGVGAKSTWDSPGKMGAGSATVEDSVLNKTVRTKLEYTRPFHMLQEAEISISDAAAASTSGSSTVTWSVKGQYMYPQKVVGLFLSMDKMVGDNFESGLSKLKSLLER